jgi:hypothetical protein
MIKANNTRVEVIARLRHTRNMTAVVILLVLLVACPLALRYGRDSPHDVRDRRASWPGSR